MIKHWKLFLLLLVLLLICHQSPTACTCGCQNTFTPITYVAYCRAKYVQWFYAKIAVFEHCWTNFISVILIPQFVHIYLETYFHICMSRLASPINVPVSMSRITLAISSTWLQSYAISLTMYRLPNYLHAQASSKCTCPITLCLRAVLHKKYM